MNLVDCEDEQIRVPGAIQQHGILLVLDSATEDIIWSAGDTKALLQFVGNPVGRSFHELAGRPLSQLTQKGELISGHEPLFLGTVKPQNAGHFDIVAHKRGVHILIEFEPSLQDIFPAARLLGRLREGVAAIRRTIDVIAACQAAGDSVRALSGHERVMVYQFLDDDAGKVIAESKAETMDSFKNQHFPAGDVPRQARDLYLQNLIRVIADVDYTPSPLSGAGKAKLLDLSDCSLRSVSPIHIQYLKNMGVKSSMSVSIVVNGNLWGLIACHGLKRRLVPYELREACKHLANALAHSIESILKVDRFEQIRLLLERRSQLMLDLAKSDALETELKLRIDDLASVIQSSGLIVCLDGKIETHGVVPAPSKCKEICDLARSRQGITPYSTSMLSSQLEDSAGYSDIVSGVLAITLILERPLQILWLRPEYCETIEWAGHPHQGAPSPNSHLSLNPRTSFGAWRETVRGQSEPWSAPEIEAAQIIRQEIERILVNQRISILQAKLVHMSRVTAMEAMASSIAHELNQPLTVVHNYIVSLRFIFASREERDSEVLNILRRVFQQSLRAGEILRKLRRIVANRPMVLKPHSARKIIEGACSFSFLEFEQFGILREVKIREDFLVMADPVQIQQVLINLIANSVHTLQMLEYSHERKLSIKVQKISCDFIEFSVSDTGPGFEAGIYDALFTSLETSKEGGLGIGLSISRTIIEAHGGKICAEGPPGGGTTFRFTLKEASELD